MEPLNTNNRHRRTLLQRVFAWVMAHAEVSEETDNSRRKRAMLSSLHGSILEIGPGAGPNLRYFPADVDWVGVEPNLFMHPYLEQSIQALGWPAGRYRIEPGDPVGVRLPAENESIDAVVSTHVLCSVPQLGESLREILRVLKPGGRFVFLEHVAAPGGSRLRRAQNFIQPVWTVLGDGCYPNREIGESISSAGFARVEFEHYHVPGGGPAGPHIAGVAIKNG